MSPISDLVGGAADNADKIKASAQSTTSLTKTKLTCSRSSLSEKMESRLGLVRRLFSIAVTCVASVSVMTLRMRTARQPLNSSSYCYLCHQRWMEIRFSPLFVCLSVGEQDIPKSYRQI